MVNGSRSRLLGGGLLLASLGLLFVFVTGGLSVAEFASTYKEWHYLIGGVSIGYLFGWVSSSLYRYRGHHHD